MFDTPKFTFQIYFRFFKVQKGEVAKVKLFKLGGLGDVTFKKLKGKAAEFYLGNLYLGLTDNVKA